MTSSDLRRALAVPLLVAAACGGGSSKSLSPGGPNVVAVSVAGAGCAPNTPYINEPCVSVTVCAPSGSPCQTVPDVLLDTGSTGLRVFKGVLGPLVDSHGDLTLPGVSAGNGTTLGECIAYLDQVTQWGPVVTANVVLGGEPAASVPIQVIDAGFASGPPSPCTGAEKAPTLYNGILGVSELDRDCGTDCTNTTTPNQMYYACSGSGCGNAFPAVESQVRNPVAALPLDLNGVIVRLPAIPGGAAPSVDGELVLGIGSRTNNVPPASVVAFPLGAGLPLTTFSDPSVKTPSFLDSGSNGIFFPPPSASLVTCNASGSGSAWFCPSSPVTVHATLTPSTGPPSADATFTIASIDALSNTTGASSQVGGPAVVGPSNTTYVDFGLPFFFGRDVYVVIEGRPSRFGVGPIIAY